MEKVSRTRMIVATGMLGAVSTVLMSLSFHVPLTPSFLKMDLSELPALLAACAYGPVSGIAVCIIKNLINALMSTSFGVGELSNMLLGTAFVLPAGLIYSRRKTRLTALLGSLLGALCMALFSLPVNYYLIYPIYTQFMPLDGILEMYRAIVPAIRTLWDALLIINLPFTLVKGLVSVLITFLIYKPLSPILKGRRV